MLCYQDVYLVFDRYKTFSIKSNTRSQRAKDIAYRHKLGLQTCLPAKDKVLSCTSNKIQLIDIVCKYITEKVLTITEIYNLYKEFYNTSKGQLAVEGDFLMALKNSAQLIDAKVHDPMSPPKTKVNSKKLKMKKSSLRGDSRFVNMAICDLSDPSNPDFIDRYVNTDSDEDSLTESLDVIRNTGLIDYVVQKDGRINEKSLISKIPAKQMSKRKILLEGAATSPEHAIYLSYIATDLGKIGESEPYEEAIYYAICEKQVIGKISLNQFINK